MNVEQAYAKDLSNLQAIVNWAVDMQLHGSFSDRRPDLGRNFTCPHCHQRRRANGPRCCNPKFATTQRAWTPELGFHQTECAERSNENPISQAFIKRMIHQQTKRHGQSRNFHIRHQTFLFQHYPELIIAAAHEMRLYTRDKDGNKTIQPSLIEPQHIPAFAERYFKWVEERKDKRTRRRADISRRINRGISV